MKSIDLDRRFNWHPFTPTDEWLAPEFEPVSIVRGEGSRLWDERGREYWDGNSSIWTITHGHRHPSIVAALKQQLDCLEHSSFLGLTHPWSGELASQLSQLADGNYRAFFSDDGSTAIEAALKIVWQFFQQNAQHQRREFLSLAQGYHGDTLGAMSVSHSGAFHACYEPLRFPTGELMMPKCHGCPYNQATWAPQDARLRRSCQMQCATQAEERIRAAGDRLAAVVIEPRVQGPAGMVMHPEGYLARIAAAVRDVGARLIVDEVFTGFGRTGTMLAFQHEPDVKPDLICLGKGLTGGFLPMAATLVNEDLFDGFRGGFERTFFHGHSYTANPLGCAAALANLAIYSQEQTLDRIRQRSQELRVLAQTFWEHPQVGDVRVEGFILAVELMADREAGIPYLDTARLAHRVSEAARQHGLLTRGRANTLFLLPPYGTSSTELQSMVAALKQALDETVLTNP